MSNDDISNKTLGLLVSASIIIALMCTWLIYSTITIKYDEHNETMQDISFDNITGFYCVYDMDDNFPLMCGDFENTLDFIKDENESNRMYIRIESIDGEIIGGN